MSAQSLANSFSCLGGAVFLYHVTEGALLKAASVPLTGYGLKKMGEYFKLPTITTLGKSLLLASGVSFPGAIVGRTICIAGGEKFEAKVLGCVLSFEVTCKVFDRFIYLLSAIEKN